MTGGRLKCCPFCGEPEIGLKVIRGSAASIYCNSCGATGPAVEIDCPLSSDNFDSEEDFKDYFDDCVKTAEDYAGYKWNCRPPMSDFYVDELATFEQYGETIESLEREIWEETEDE